ncbi:MAG: undecaprenyl-diphosphate phosphatase [Candidatus Parcubacteria bacterium]|nr:undecaprenyl-diphosphate phosphatase [Candidatus Parcubacteria bacterium]
MITYLQAIILGAIQGATELFPVSSLGHSVIIPQILGWNIDQNTDFFLNFLIATHLATSLVLLAFFFRDWMRIIGGIFRSIVRFRIDPADTYAKLGWLLILATIPAGLLGLLLEHRLKLLLASPIIVSVALILNGCLLYCVEFLTHRHEQAPAGDPDQNISVLSWKSSLKVGVAQALALIPGFSRTGATLGGGLLIGLSHRDAARFSFLLATPIIFAAAVLKVPALIKTGTADSLNITLAGVIGSAICAFLSIRYLTKYFENKTLKPFAGYCIGVGIFALIVLLVRV